MEDKVSKYRASRTCREIGRNAAMKNEQRIFTVRGVAVMLDSDLAEVYGIETRNLNKAVDRNPERFAEPFSFRLTTEEWEILRFQLGTSRSWGGRRYPPRVFTEHGAVMLAAVLNSDRAIAASRAVVDAFVRIRRVLGYNQALAKRIDELAVETAGNRRRLPSSSASCANWSPRHPNRNRTSRVAESDSRRTRNGSGRTGSLAGNAAGRVNSR